MKKYKVRSQTDKNKIYNVQIHETFETCDCEAFKFKKRCKHINLILDKYYRE